LAANPPPPLDPAYLGTVYVARIDGDDWDGSWQRGDEHREFSGPREEVVAWARAQTASQYLILDENQGYLSLPPHDR
jgi:hypothetical protein